MCLPISPPGLGKIGGAFRSRTGLDGFAIRYITALLTRLNSVCLCRLKLVITSFTKFGAGNETRTRDPDLGKVVLYQLSYSRINQNLLIFLTLLATHRCRLMRCILLIWRGESIKLLSHQVRLPIFTSLRSRFQQIAACRVQILEHRPEGQHGGDVQQAKRQILHRRFWPPQQANQ